MLAKIITKPTSVLHEILDWSANRPDWQRDALRRIIVNDDLTEKDKTELEQLCRKKHDIHKDKTSEITSTPLEPSHLPSSSGAESSVSVVSIKEIQNVNRLPQASIINFGSFPGLTIIFGENGTGKSGFVRILKKACRARGVAPIIKNDVFQAIAARKPAATIVVNTNGKNVEYKWEDGVHSDATLSNIFVFDSKSAEHYLQEEDSASFTPFGLDVLPTLSKICDTIGTNLKSELDGLKKVNSAVNAGWSYNPTSEVGQIISGLKHDSSIEVVKKIACMTEEEKLRLITIRETLKSDPVQKAKETRASANRLKQLSILLSNRETELSDASVSQYRELLADVKAKNDIAISFISQQFDSTYLPGTGGVKWKNLWESAQIFSNESVYVGAPYPNTSETSQCVLCQQALDALAKKRFTEFDIFYRDQSQVQANQAEIILNAEIKFLAGKTLIAPELIEVEADLVGLTKEEEAGIKGSVKALDERLASVLSSLKLRAWSELALVPASDALKIDAMVAQLEERAKVEESAQDPEMKEKMQAESEELSARAWLEGVIHQVEEQIGRLKQIKRLEDCAKDVVTTSITTKNSELTEQFVTKAYCDKFTAELKHLGLSTLPVKIEPIKGKKAETKFGIRLVGTTDQNIIDIASEGEQRCISLAAFLAELSQSSHQSTLIFDDPVSSLDHSYRRNVAARLVDESKSRQVIIFTHDVILLSDLQSSSKAEKIIPTIKCMEWNNNAPGACYDGLPWELKSVDQRFDVLEKELTKLQKTWNPAPNDQNKSDMRHAYSLLRASLERIVEKVILCDSIFRYRSYLDVAKLRGLVGFTIAEYEHLMKLMQRCHDVTDAHDPASGKISVVPSPDELLADLAETKLLVKEIKDRQTIIKSSIKSVT
jgi:energy-coupling factor transporter ATP-binding protein EcfA2